ncbi:OST-HTH/LOTUS domain-containing protein [Agromyces mariniharenae]|uniref:OST-HTH/LOTUS domain-containing protein n=1 Tax=Agromyces mariniharenae TaxID=2604423 RepID=UPI003B75C3BA
MIETPVADGVVESAPVRAQVPTTKLRTDGRLVSVLRASVGSAAGEDGRANLAAVGSLLRKQQPDFDSRNWGYAKLSDLIRATGLFDVVTAANGGVMVQQKRKAA